METSPKTKFFKPEESNQKWYVIDADGKTLGRIATQAARLLRGKHKPQFTPNFDTGDFVVIINAEKVQVTGKRVELKELFRTSGYPGGQKFELFRDLVQTKPEYVFEHAVKGMLPHNRLGKKILKKLKVYRGSNHPHAAQQPQPFQV